jgi:aspartyl-tRNA(Asn)/glutamyl-tRNA(Gln) amidotransferase subunit B
MAEIASVQLKVGLEIHVQLATRTKMFCRAPSVACREFDHKQSEPNSCIDPLVLGLPGSLPVINREAVQMAMMVGLALGCSIAPLTRWDRKSYFYPDLPKSYQISQYDLPLCFDGAIDMPLPGEDGRVNWEDYDTKRIGIIRAHLEEDAGKLLHEAPGGLPIDYSILDLNRAGCPLLEIVTHPDFTTSGEVVAFAQMLRNICRFLGVSEGVLQKGHMRFEPNINTVITLTDGRLVRTPIVEVKNLNSFKAVRGAIEYEFAEQPKRWQREKVEMSPGSKSTRGWDDVKMQTVLQREKEEAADYRYFPDPDLLPVVVDKNWLEQTRASIPQLPMARLKRYIDDFGLHAKEAAALVDERDVCFFYEECIAAAKQAGVEPGKAGKAVANVLLQSGAKRANERSAGASAGSTEQVLISDLGITPKQIGQILAMRERGELGSNAADELFGLLCEPGQSATDAQALAQQRGMLIVRDDAAMGRWCDEAIAQNAKAAEDVKSGKDAAIGRLVGAVMKLSGGRVDAAGVREALLKKLRS